MDEIIWKARVFCKICFIRLFSKKTQLFNDEAYNSILYYIIFGKKGDFRCPRTFNEYVIHNKLYANEDGFERFTDKYEVRKYVEKKVGIKYLNKVLGIYDSPLSIPFDRLPKAFVLKGTHGSGYNMIITDKSEISRDKVIRQFDKWLKQNYYFLSRERNYKNIHPRIVCEQYLQSTDNAPLNEVKLWCFNGVVKIIADTRVIDGMRRINLYDRSKQVLDVRMGAKNHSMKLTGKIDEMISVAEQLSNGFEFVRVDLYDVDDRIVFSELTFHPGGGLVPFVPAVWDTKIAMFVGEN